MTLRDTILAAAATREGMAYQIDPPPDGIHTIDCSLFVLKTLEDAGAPLVGVRTAEQIRQACPLVVDWPDVQPGDLLFFTHTYEPSEAPGPDGETASHIGISLGAGTHQMWNAVEGPGVTLTRIDTPFWQQHILEARRIPQLVAQPSPAPADQPRGIDVSSNNGSIDWPAVAASGISFAWIKVTEDDGYLNPRFESDWLLSRRVGLCRGAYHFARPEQSDATQEADYFLDQIDAHGGLGTGDLLALDLESGSGDLGQWALDFLHHVEQRVGFKPFVYTAPWFSAPHGVPLHPDLAGYPLWQAAYSATVPAPAAPWTAITIWQHADDGSVPGISGDVDLNVSLVSIDQLRALGMPAAAPAPVPAADPRDEQISGLITAVAYLADNVAAIDDHDQRVAEAARVRLQFLGPKTAA